MPDVGTKWKALSELISNLICHPLCPFVSRCDSCWIFVNYSELNFEALHDEWLGIICREGCENHGEILDFLRELFGNCILNHKLLHLLLLAPLNGMQLSVKLLRSCFQKTESDRSPRKFKIPFTLVFVVATKQKSVKTCLEAERSIKLAMLDSCCIWVTRANFHSRVLSIAKTLNFFRNRYAFLAWFSCGNFKISSKSAEWTYHRGQ